MKLPAFEIKLTAVSEQLAQFEAGQHEATAAASNAELARQRFEAELAARQEELKNLKRLLADREAQSYDLQQTFTAQLQDLQRELAEKQGLLEARSQEVGELTARTSDLQEQITCLELANKQTVKEAKAAARAIEDSLRARVQELEATVSEKAQGLQNRTTELESAQSETALLRERIQHLELTARTDRGGQERSAPQKRNAAERIRQRSPSAGAKGSDVRATGSGVQSSPTKASRRNCATSKASWRRSVRYLKSRSANSRVPGPKSPRSGTGCTS